MERSLEENRPIKKNTPTVLNSTELSGAMATEIITISSVASPEPRIVTIDSHSNEPTISYGFGSQHPIVPPSLNDLNLPPNPFNVLARIAVIRVDEEYSLQSQEPTIPSPISTPPMNVTTIEDWETTNTTTDNATSYIDGESPDEPIGVFPRVTPLSPMSQEMYLSLRTLSPHRRLHEDKKEAEHGDVFSQKGGVSQNTCDACSQTLPAKNTP